MHLPRAVAAVNKPWTVRSLSTRFFAETSVGSSAIAVTSPGIPAPTVMSRRRRLRKVQAGRMREMRLGNFFARVDSAVHSATSVGGTYDLVMVIQRDTRFPSGHQYSNFPTITLLPSFPTTPQIKRSTNELTFLSETTRAVWNTFSFFEPSWRFRSEPWISSTLRSVRGDHYGSCSNTTVDHGRFS